MSAFEMAALLSPLLLGIFVPLVLALGREGSWTVRRRVASLVALLLSWTLLLGVLWIASAEPFSRLAASLAFLAQVSCGFAVVLMVGTLFYFDPILEEAQGGPPESFQARIDIAMEWNPYVVMAYSIFEDDLLTHRSLYTRTLLADLPRVYPDWSRSAFRYLALAGALSLFFLGSSFLRRRFRER